MDTIIRTITVLVATAGAGAVAQDPSCRSTLTIHEAVVAMGEGVAAQPVFTKDTVKGYRLYNTRNAPQLTAQAIHSGDLMTHVCGVAANDIQSRGGVICCDTDASKEFEVTFEVSGETRKILIQRPVPRP